MLKQIKVIALFISAFLLVNTFQSYLSAKDNRLYPGYPLTTESNAYKQFLVRPNNGLSKLIFLTDRLAESKVQVLYEGTYYPAGFAAAVARVFLPIHYHNEPVEQWVLKFCNTTLVKGELVWVKLPNGDFRLAREVLLKELKSLNQAVKEKKPYQPMTVEPANSSTPKK